MLNKLCMACLSFEMHRWASFRQILGNETSAIFSLNTKYMLFEAKHSNSLLPRVTSCAMARWGDKSDPAHARTLSHRSVFRTLDEGNELKKTCVRNRTNHLKNWRLRNDVKSFLWRSKNLQRIEFILVCLQIDLLSNWLCFLDIFLTVNWAGEVECAYANYQYSDKNHAQNWADP